MIMTKLIPGLVIFGLVIGDVQSIHIADSHHQEELTQCRISFHVDHVPHTSIASSMMTNIIQFP